ncbi:MAG: type II toxin-antitoxin system RelE/ParE family toxin [Bacteroidota bacterium]|nr:type II toxin-antitoxin system RelE/ParE family toxin [Bacteroidota bacterium]
MSLQIRINKKFLKELSQIPPYQRAKIEQFVFIEISKLNSKEKIRNLKRLKGYKHHYRIRFGNYRAGITILDNVVIFQRLLHRKDIYKYYP